MSVPLDFLTLYIVIFLNSLTVSVIWAAFAWRYRPHKAALHWLAACLLALAGGVVLALQSHEAPPVFAVAGNIIIVFGFSQFWIGLRRFDGLGGGQGIAAVITAVAAIMMVLLWDHDRARSITYATGQSVVLGLCALHVLRLRPLSLGAIISACAFGVAVAGQLMVVGGNVGVLWGVLPFPTFYALASYALLCTIFSGSVWNLGFAIMTIDKLQVDLARLSHTDELTGLANRRALVQRLEAAHAAGQPYALMLIDLDHFKALNDTYGHAFGDAALVILAEELAGGVRPHDFVARLGGDEFCILVPDMTVDEIRPVAERLQQRLAARRLDGERASSARLSGSIGLAGWVPGDELGPDAVMAAADRSLYAVKSRRPAGDVRARLRVAGNS